MDQAKNLWLKMELIWWLVTLILVVAILYPILQNTNDYPFLTLNILYIVAFVTLSRHLFLSLIHI